MTVPLIDREADIAQCAGSGRVGMPGLPTAAQCRCLRETLDRVATRASLFHLFLQQDLARHSPALRQFVTDPMGEPDGTVLPLLNFLVACLDEPSVGRMVLQDIAFSLARRGLNAVQQPELVAAISRSIARALGSRWTPEVAAAWSAFEAWGLEAMAGIANRAP